MVQTMKYIIPAKAESIRCPNKNWRNFYKGYNLVEITIRKLTDIGVSPEDIYLSCDSYQVAKSTIASTRVNFLQRSPELCSNEVPLTTWLRSIVSQTPNPEDEVAWCQVCDPLFNDYHQCLDRWYQINKIHDSLVVCRPWKGYLLTEQNQPIGWSFGEHHTPSQHLPRYHTMPFTLSILTPAAIQTTGYHVGRSPYWYTSEGPHIDIDTEFDYLVAKIAYAELINTQ